MAKRKRALAAARMLLQSLEDLVDGERWNLDTVRLAEWRREPWAGADVVVCTAAPEGYGDGDTHVATPFTGELSWLIEYVKQVFSGFIDFQNKYAFYGRLADAAIRYHATREPSLQNPKDLCFAVLREAARILGEEERGGFADRDTVLLKGVEVRLFYDGGKKGKHMALWRQPVHGAVDLVGTAFSHRGGTWRIGKVLQRAGDDDSMNVIAAFHEDGADAERPERS
jgi:hypothetical protein